jgi:hypothetical protein
LPQVINKTSGIANAVRLEKIEKDEVRGYRVRLRTLRCVRFIENILTLTLWYVAAVYALSITQNDAVIIASAAVVHSMSSIVLENKIHCTKSWITLWRELVHSPIKLFTGMTLRVTALATLYYWLIDVSYQTLATLVLLEFLRDLWERVLDSDSHP